MEERKTTVFERINRFSIKKKGLNTRNKSLSFCIKDHPNIIDDTQNQNIPNEVPIINDRIDNLKFEYDFGAQNYLINFPENKKKSLTSDNIAEIPTRKRIKSFVYSVKRGSNIVILNSKKEELDIKLSFESKVKTNENVLDVLSYRQSTNIFVRFLKNIKTYLKQHVQNITESFAFSNDPDKKAILLCNSSFQLAWDILIFLFIFFEFYIIPLQISFDLDLDKYLMIIIDSFLFLIFCLDIYLGSKTSFINNRGVMELNSLIIASKYYKNFLIIDILASLPTNLILEILSALKNDLFDLNIDYWDYTKFICLNKFFRISRILRTINRIDRAKDFYSPALVRIVKAFCFFILLWHWLACLYWFISNIEGFSPNGFSPDPSLQNSCFPSQYSFSLLWAVTATVGVGISLFPASDLQLIFTGISIIIGFSIYTIILGSSSTAFFSIDDQDGMMRKQLESLKIFMRKKKVKLDLQKRIEENLKYLWTSRQSTNFGSQWFLDDVNTLLKFELSLQINKKYIEKIPMFKDISFKCLVFLLTLLQNRICLPEEYVVCEGTYVQNLYFIQSGILEVIDTKKNTRIRLYDGEFFGEQSLFVHRRKSADVKCLSYSELTIITKGALSQMINRFPEFALNLFNYLKKKEEIISKKDLCNPGKHDFWLFLRGIYKLGVFLRKCKSSLNFEDLFFQNKEFKSKKKDLKLKQEVVAAFSNQKSHSFLNEFTSKMNL